MEGSFLDGEATHHRWPRHWPPTTVWTARRTLLKKITQNVQRALSRNLDGLYRASGVCVCARVARSLYLKKNNIYKSQTPKISQRKRQRMAEIRRRGYNKYKVKIIKRFYGRGFLSRKRKDATHFLPDAPFHPHHFPSSDGTTTLVFSYGSVTRAFRSINE